MKHVEDKIKCQDGIGNVKDGTTSRYKEVMTDSKVRLRCVGDVTAKPPHVGDGLIKMSAIDTKHTADGMGLGVVGWLWWTGQHLTF